MEDILKKLHEGGDVSFGSYVDGKLIDSKDFSIAIKSSENAAELWKNNVNRHSVLNRISSGLRNKTRSFLEVTSLCSYMSRDSITSDLEQAISGFNYFSRLSRHVNLINQDCTGQGVIGAAILEECALFSMLSWLTAAPLAAGNTVILLIKPSYSIISLYFVSVLHEFGLPNGVVNVIPFVEHETFSEIASHLSRNVGIIPGDIKSSADFHFSSVIVKKHTSCPLIVLKSADIDSVIDTFITLSQNQELTWFPNVIFVEEPVYENFLASLKFNAIKYNAGREKFIENGVECRKILNTFIDEKKGQGFEVIELTHRFSNCFVIVNEDSAVNKSFIVDENKTIHQIVSLLPIRTASEGISRSNSTPGLAVSLWSNDAVDIIRLPSLLQYGTIWVNCAALYCPSAPFSLWHSNGYGTFSGKRGFYENVTKSSLELLSESNDNLYAADRNSIFPNKNISSMIKQSVGVQSTWFKLSKENRLLFIENTAKEMDQNWNSHFKIVLDETSESSWKSAIKYLNFWSSYGFENDHQQLISTKKCEVICKTEPIGVIAIIAGSIPFDLLAFLIVAALVYGNSVIVGLSSDEKSSIIASELENIFRLENILSAKSNLVSVLVNNTSSLWQQFIASKNVASVWFVKNFASCPAENHGFKSVVECEGLKDMTQTAKFFEIYATKAKAIWLPGA